MTYVLRPRARADLFEIWNYGVDTWGEAQAEKYALRLNEAFNLIADYPEMTRLRPDIDPLVRLHSVGSHVILYEVNAARVQILRIVHNRRDISDVVKR